MNLDSQLVKALDGAPSAVATMTSQIGTKDRYFMSFVDKIQKAAVQFWSEDHSEIDPGNISQADKLWTML